MSISKDPNNLTSNMIIFIVVSLRIILLIKLDIMNDE
jgi:hypothetical protein